jgi:tRNA threonylcarbamoyladenosine biosynthesis protein TsaE
MGNTTKSVSTRSPVETAALARDIGRVLLPGDTILLTGPIGAGKSHFCRHLILSRLDRAEDIPSPTFTLVQTYETEAVEIWHSDLYRLGGPSEVEELGLFDAFETSICLVEWPDRLGEDAPENALWLTITPHETEADTRELKFEWTDPKWLERLKDILDE